MQCIENYTSSIYQQQQDDVVMMISGRPQQMSREDGVTRGDVFCSQHRAVCVTLPRHCVTWQHHMSRTCDTPWQGPSCCYLNTRPSPRARDKSTEIFYLPNYFHHSILITGLSQVLFSNCGRNVSIQYRLPNRVLDIWYFSPTQSALELQQRKVRDI